MKTELIKFIDPTGNDDNIKQPTKCRLIEQINNYPSTYFAAFKKQKRINETGERRSGVLWEHSRA